MALQHVIYKDDARESETIGAEAAREPGSAKNRVEHPAQRRTIRWVQRDQKPQSYPARDQPSPELRPGLGDPISPETAPLVATRA
jgi:hypothetical protein